MKVVLFLWPGASGVFRYGLWEHLGIALLFGIICQTVLFSTFYWTAFLSTLGRAFIGCVAVVAWILLSVAASASLRKYEKMRGADKSGEAFLEAQTYYLRGDWFETECCLKKIIKKNRCDVEARLLAATLFRHLKRFSEARKMLAELEKMETSAYWQDEIKQERTAIALEEETDKKSAESPVSSNEDIAGTSEWKV